MARLLFEELGLAPGDGAGLRRAPVEAILAAQARCSLRTQLDGLLAFRPVIDGRALPGRRSTRSAAVWLARGRRDRRLHARRVEALLVHGPAGGSARRGDAARAHGAAGAGPRRCHRRGLPRGAGARREALRRLQRDRARPLLRHSGGAAGRGAGGRGRARVPVPLQLGGRPARRRARRLPRHRRPLRDGLDRNARRRSLRGLRARGRRAPGSRDGRLARLRAQRRPRPRRTCRSGPATTAAEGSRWSWGGAASRSAFPTTPSCAPGTASSERRLRAKRSSRASTSARTASTWWWRAPKRTAACTSWTACAIRCGWPPVSPGSACSRTARCGGRSNRWSASASGCAGCRAARCARSAPTPCARPATPRISWCPPPGRWATRSRSSPAARRRA